MYHVNQAGFCHGGVGVDAVATIGIFDASDMRISVSAYCAWCVTGAVARPGGLQPGPIPCARQALYVRPFSRRAPAVFGHGHGVPGGEGGAGAPAATLRVHAAPRPRRDAQVQSHAHGAARRQDGRQSQGHGIVDCAWYRLRAGSLDQPTLK